MVSVKNRTADARAFYDKKLKKRIIVEAGDTFDTECPPEQNNIWGVKDYEKKSNVPKKERKQTEEDINDSSSS